MAKFARKCPNCGQITDGDDCDWCKFPIRPLRVKRGQRTSKAEEHTGADKQTGIVVIEKAASDLKEARKALEAEIAGWERFQQEEEARKAAEVEKNRIVANAEEAFKAEEIIIVTDAEEAFEAEEVRIVTDTEEAFKTVKNEESISAEDEEAGKVEGAEVADEVVDAKETGIAAEVKEDATAEFDEKLMKMVARREAVIKAQSETDQIKNPVDANGTVYSTTGNVSPIVAEFVRPRLYRKIVEPLLSLPITPGLYEKLKKYLEMVERINQDLNHNKIATEEAIKRLKEISLMPSW